ncbi:MAG TPA: NarK family nitrate/nitrite MFS transporter [Tepidisphaeraceae bacterium]|nr:NarK family nitrate/nitrite MFS transporter [Tepidisphaeraceae bacterium]
MDTRRKATRIDFFNFSTPQMRAFHMSWFAFLLCFFAWFGIAPMMKVIRAELKLTPEQVGNLVIASVAITVIARLLVGWLCDRIGPRLSYSGLLILGSVPVMCVGFAHDYHTFLLLRLGIGMIGASFVITQYHTSTMFAPNIVGTANATTAGWGNMGGGVTQFVMPLVFAGFVAMGLTKAHSWRASMLAAGIVCLLTGIGYFFLTQDSPSGNFKDLRARGEFPAKKYGIGNFFAACADYRVWLLFVVYAACFGIELTIDNTAHLYFSDNFKMDLERAGMVAAILGGMNLFARSLGGYVADRFGRTGGLRGRVRWLFAVLLAEGLFMAVFSRMTAMPMAIASLMFFGLCVDMACGATYAVVPFINKKSLGSVSGIVGAGGNVGAVLAGFLFKGPTSQWSHGLLLLGCAVAAVSFLALGVRFSEQDEIAARQEFEDRLLPVRPDTAPAAV